jgi:hypothetical protein
MITADPGGVGNFALLPVTQTAKGFGWVKGAILPGMPSIPTPGTAAPSAAAQPVIGGGMTEAEKKNKQFAAGYVNMDWSKVALGRSGVLG